MATFRRFAVYWAPPRGSALARFGASWLGWDADSGRKVPHPELPGLPAPASELTATPRRYGFHATLKPPFRLAEHAQVAALERGARDLAAGIGAFEAPSLSLRPIGRFVALVPSAPCPELAELAARCVRTLDPFRAPPGGDELARRRAAGISPAQEALLARWGYPYVLDEFRFHLTLTGALDPGQLPAVLDALAGPTEPFRAAPLPITEICLFAEDETAHFRVLGRYPLTG